MKRLPFLFLVTILTFVAILLLPNIHPRQSPPIEESYVACSHLLTKTIYSNTDLPPFNPPRITPTPTHHSSPSTSPMHLMYPHWEVTGTYTSFSGPFAFTCSATLNPTSGDIHVALLQSFPGSPFIGTPVSNTQCLDLRNAPHTSTMAYIAYQLERGHVADRRILYHLGPCPPDPPSMSATPEGN